MGANVASQPVNDFEVETTNQVEPFGLLTNSLALKLLAADLSHPEFASKTDSEGLLPGDDAVVSSKVPGGAFDFTGVLSAVDNFESGRDSETVDPLVSELPVAQFPVAASGVPAGIETAQLGPVDADLGSGVSPALIDSLGLLPKAQQKIGDLVTAQSKQAADDLTAASRLESPDIQRPADQLQFIGQHHRKHRLLPSGETDLRDTSFNLISYEQIESEFDRSDLGVASVFPLSRSSTAFSLHGLRSQVSIAGQSIELLSAFETVWSQLSGRSLFRHTASEIVSHVSAVSLLPAWWTQTNRTIKAPELIEFADTSVMASRFVEVAEPVGHDSFQQTTKQTLARIEAEVVMESLGSAPCDDPPQRSDISGIWQRLRFDCNPRGPPRDEPNLISGFTRHFGGDDQLQQLRFSIAPRGPSVAFCN